MKRQRSLVAIIATLAIIFSMQSVSFAWTTGSSNNGYNVTDGNKVETSINSLGQTVYRVYQRTGNQKILIHEIFARGSNIWNNTTSVLLANGKNKSASYCGIDRNLNVYGIEDVNGNNNQDIATRFKYGFNQWDTPERLTEYPGAYGFKYDDDGFVIGIYTRSGLYDIQTDQIINDSNNSILNSGLNWNYDPGYPYVVQDNNTYTYYISRYKSFVYTLSSSNLKINGTTIASGIEEVTFGKGAILAVDYNNTSKQSAIGSTYMTTLCENFADWIRSDDDWVISAKDIYGETYRVTSFYNSSYDNQCNDNNHTGYPCLIANGDYITYYKSPYTQYTYKFISSENLYYGDMFIASSVDEVGFSENYMLYATGTTAKMCRLGATYADKTYDDFIEFEYDDNDMIIGVVTRSGTEWL